MVHDYLQLVCYLGIYAFPKAFLMTPTAPKRKTSSAIKDVKKTMNIWLLNIAYNPVTMKEVNFPLYLDFNNIFIK